MKDKKATAAKLMQVCKFSLHLPEHLAHLRLFLPSIVRYHSEGSQTYRQLDVWLSRFRRISFLRSTSRCTHDVQRSRDSHPNESRCGEYVAECESRVFPLPRNLSPILILPAGQVIYGDTDSVMINTNQDKYEEALKIGNEFKKLINEKYRKLEIDTDAVFSRMLLLNKKKYAARKVDDDGKGGPGAVSTEIKGLDMKRREYSKLSKNASK